MSHFFHVVHLTAKGKEWKPGENWPENGFVPLGTREEVLAVIARLFPNSNLSDPLWIPVQYVVGDAEWGMEILIDHDEPVGYLSLRHGSSEAGRIYHEAMGWDVFDPNNERINFDS